MNMPYNTKQIVSIIAAVVIAACGLLLFGKYGRESEEQPRESAITVDSPAAGEKIIFPLTVRGSVTGNDGWAVAGRRAGTVRVLDAGDQPLTNIQPLAAVGDSADYPVRFEAVFYESDVLNAIETDTGFLVFTADSDGQGAPQYRLPVRLEKSPTEAGLIIESPKANDAITLPVTVKGSVSGENFWTPFEGQAGTVQVFDADDTAVTIVVPLTVQGDWTKFPASFEVKAGKTQDINKAKTDAGYLLFRNENASGEPVRDREFRLPIRFNR